MTQQQDLGARTPALQTTIADRQADNRRVITPDESPRGETETAVGRLFAEMLGTPGVPRTASFFDLGLDSVSVTVACAQLEQITGVRIRFTQLFRTPTVAQLAAWIDATRGKPDDERGVPTKPPAEDGVALVAITPLQAQSVAQNIVVELGWWFDGELDESALASAATDIHRRHQTLHARYLGGAETGLAELPADPGQAEFHRLGQEDSDTAASDVLWRTLRQPLRPAEGVIWRCATVRSAESGRILFGLVVDHIAFDGQSWDILTAELPVAYAARAAGTSPQWPRRTASVAEMAADFRHQLAAADVDGQRRHWLDELRGVPACRLPGRTDGRVPMLTPAEGSMWSPPGSAAVHGFSLSNSQLRVWDEYARAKGMPPSVGMAAVYVQAIIRAGGSRDFAMMVPIANRAGEVIDGTITNRVGNILLRPNGPSRSGPHILARMQDSYYQAMAARDVLLYPSELESLLGGEGSDGVIHLEKMVALNYNSVPTLDLGGVAGTIPRQLGSGPKCMFVVMLQVLPGPDGLDMHILVRTDMCEDELAGRLGQHFVDIINDGPERLELNTPAAAALGADGQLSS